MTLKVTDVYISTLCIYLFSDILFCISGAVPTLQMLSCELFRNLEGAVFNSMLRFPVTTRLVERSSATLHDAKIPFRSCKRVCAASLSSFFFSFPLYIRQGFMVGGSMSVYLSVCLTCSGNSWESVPWNVWAGFPLFPTGADRSHTRLSVRNINT